MCENYGIRSAEQNEIGPINALLEENFHCEEKMLSCLLSRGLSGPTAEELEQIKEDQRTIISAMIMHFPCQVLIREPAKNIVGVNVMLGVNNPNIQLTPRFVDVFTLYPPKCQVLADYYKYMSDIIEKADLFSRFPRIERALEFYALTVEKEHRMKGLSRILIEEGITLAQKKGFDMVYGLFTSPFSKKSAASAGMVNIMDYNLLDYKDTEGNSVFMAAYPDHIVSVKALILR